MDYHPTMEHARAPLPIAPAQEMAPREPIPAYAEIESSGTQRKRTKKDRACDLCRRKKIRCDYNHTLPNRPCLSCHGYGRMCTFNEAAKKRGPPKGYVEGLESRLRRMEELLVNVANSGNLHTGSATDLLDDEAEPAENESTVQKQKTKRNAPDNETDTDNKPLLCHHGHENFEEASNGQASNAKPSYAYLGSSSGVYLLSQILRDRDSPSLVKGHEDDVLVPHMTADSSFIGARNARTSKEPFAMPHPEITDYLITLYFKEMNPYIPIVDEHDFWDRYRSGDDEAVLPVAMSMCRSACQLLSTNDPVLARHNITKGDLLQHVISQLSTHYSLNFMIPKIESIQILLLSAAHSIRWGIESADWVGTSIAVKMAQDMGLHRTNAQWGMPTMDPNFCQRLWWSAYILDRWIGAALGRPLTIVDADCDLELPEANDDRTSTHPSFFAMAKLSIILGDVLHALCSPRARDRYSKGIGLEQVSRAFETRLKDWRRQLPGELALSEKELRAVELHTLSAELEQRLNNGAGQLHIAYSSILLFCKRSWVTINPHHTSSSIVVTPKKCLLVIKEILSVFQALRHTSMLKWGWSISSYCLAQTIMFTFLNYQNADPVVAANAHRQAELFGEHYRGFEDYISHVDCDVSTFMGLRQTGKPSIIPCLERLAQVITSGLEVQVDSGVTPSVTMAEKQRLLWAMASGVDWQDMITLLSNA